MKARSLLLAEKSLKGKSRLREAAICLPSWDGTWICTEERDNVPFSGCVKGPWLFVRPNVNDSRADSFSRWVHATDDADFAVCALPIVLEKPPGPETC
jgi:hypothetical protein